MGLGQHPHQGETTLVERHRLLRHHLQMARSHGAGHFGQQLRWIPLAPLQRLRPHACADEVMRDHHVTCLTETAFVPAQFHRFLIRLLLSTYPCTCKHKNWLYQDFTKSTNTLDLYVLRAKLSWFGLHKLTVSM